MNLKLVVLLSFCAAVVANTAKAEYTYMGHCTDDPSVSAENVIAACTTFISKAFQEGWQLQDVPKAMVYQATAYERLGKDDKAGAVLKATVGRYPDFVPAWLKIGELLEKLKGLGMMMATVDAMVHANPNSPEVLNAACWTRAEKGEQLDTAIKDCSAALQLKPDFDHALDSRAFAWFRKGDFAQAIKDATAALAVNPKMATSLYVRGLAKAKAGDMAAGNADIVAAKAIDPGIADKYAGYGVGP